MNTKKILAYLDKRISEYEENFDNTDEVQRGILDELEEIKSYILIYG